MSNSNLKDDEFIFVSSKKSRKKTKINFTADFSQQLDESLEINKETSLRYIIKNYYVTKFLNILFLEELKQQKKKFLLQIYSVHYLHL